MENETLPIVIKLTREEAYEVFSRCLRSTEEDNLASETALKKIAHSLETAAFLSPDEVAA